MNSKILLLTLIAIVFLIGGCTPPSTPTENKTNAAKNNETEKNLTLNITIDPRIYTTLNDKDRVIIKVSLVDNSNIEIKSSQNEGYTSIKQHDAWFKPIMDEIITTRIEDEFDLLWRGSSGWFSGIVTKKGLAKLLKDSRIEKIYYGETYSFISDERDRIENITISIDQRFDPDQMKVKYLLVLETEKYYPYAGCYLLNLNQFNISYNIITIALRNVTQGDFCSLPMEATAKWTTELNYTSGKYLLQIILGKEEDNYELEFFDDRIEILPIKTSFSKFEDSVYYRTPKNGMDEGRQYE